MNRCGALLLACGLTSSIAAIATETNCSISTRAAQYACQLLKVQSARAEFYDVYENPDGTPHAVLFVCSAMDAVDPRSLTLALSPKCPVHAPLFYYFAEPFDLQFRMAHPAGKGSRVTVTSEGLVLSTAEGERRIPTEFDSKAEKRRRNDSDLSGVRTKPGNGTRGVELAVPREIPIRCCDGWPEHSANPGLNSPISFGDEVSKRAERIIPGVPNYLWYLNCALTSESMVVGFWADHGYAGLVPGGDSTAGYYYAITEELMWLNNRLPEYAGAVEYGYGWPTTQGTLPNKEWPTYVAAIETNRGPLLVIWSGPPYGAHSTVGVGYRENETGRFLILHDTWVSNPAYVNYDAYATSVVLFATVELRGNETNSFQPGTNAPAPPCGTSLVSTNFSFSPALSFSEQSYHCLEPADVNRDGRDDLIVCGFRNNYSSSARLVLYTNGPSRWTRDTSFAPALDWYECVHVARACDFDRDGDADVAVTGYWMPVRVYTNSGAALSSQPLVVGSENNSYGYTDVAWGDIDGDGHQDLVASKADPIAGKLRVFAWQTNRFQTIAEVGMPNHYYSALKLRDVNRDGLPEIVCANRRGSAVAFLNLGGRFENSPFFLPPESHGAMALDVADIDGDLYPEIVTVDDGTIIIYQNGPGGLSTTPIRLLTSGRMYAKDLKLEDLNADGLPELLVASYNTPSAIYMNRGGVFELQPVWCSPRAEPTVRIHLCEFAQGEKVVVFAKARGAAAAFYLIENIPVVDLEISAGQPALHLENLVRGRNYAIERTLQLGSGGWDTVHQFLSAGPRTNWTDLSATNSTVFYRARSLR